MRVLLYTFCLLLAASTAFAQNPLDELAKKATTAEALLNLGHLNVEARRNQEARQLFKSAEIKMKNPVEARLGLAEIRFNSADLRRAKYVCRKMERDFPKSSVSKICFGRMWLRFERSARAVENFEAVLNTGDVRAVLGLAKTYDYMNEYDKSISYYKQAIDKGAGYEAHLGLGLVLERKGDDAAALKSVRKAVSVEPNSANALYHLGRMMKSGKKAADYVRKALLIRPNWADAYGTLGQILLNSDSAGAIQAFEKAIALEPDRGTFHIGYGTAMYQQKKFDEAKVALGKALELVPNHVDATQMLAEVELKAGNVDRAVQLAEDAVQLSPNNPDICFRTAHMFYTTKRYTQANAYFIRALSMAPEKRDAKVYMGDIACERRMYDKGIAHYKEALKGGTGDISDSEIEARIKKCAPESK